MMPMLIEPEPLETRKFLHPSQILDNREPGDYSVLYWKKNSFLVKTENLPDEEDQYEYMTLSHPFETEYIDPLDEIVEAISNISFKINFNHMPKHYVSRFELTSWGEVSNISLWQKPLEKEHYEKRLRRFRNSGYSYRQLEESDLPQIQWLLQKWVDNKQKMCLDSLEKIMSEHKINSIETLINEKLFTENVNDSNKWDRFNLAMTTFVALYYESMLYDPRYHNGQARMRCEEIEARLNAIVKEHDLTLAMHKSHVELSGRMNQPLTRFYGAFLDGELMAYVETEGNNHTQCFNSRASYLVNSKSPQEFLDLCIARDFVMQGVPIFHRGYVHDRQGAPGLCEYKKKFGPMNAQIDINLIDVRCRFGPGIMYAK
ncbi:hypothetical protein COV93_04160 [Candidatus Woesearchaeota archaeon CG11_big_fil_rev_8_21_14_0_20_43_8]|nr:MAG: hypothetical protein COV93_04160 [Candidatus Woesearchaeota archaeon CG11_big_fil_rev_8_21_14_0_20_43_8]PIO05709.1 MAG: hypothetical protein COT47_03660 [Candidatus Woesearchaeota archaeon CG08_land_8_20_14_0_20_43_7]